MVVPSRGPQVCGELLPVLVLVVHCLILGCRLGAGVGPGHRQPSWMGDHLGVSLFTRDASCQILYLHHDPSVGRNKISSKGQVKVMEGTMEGVVEGAIAGVLRHGEVLGLGVLLPLGKGAVEALMPSFLALLVVGGTGRSWGSVVELLVGRVGVYFTWFRAPPLPSTTCGPSGWKG